MTACLKLLDDAEASAQSPRRSTAWSVGQAWRRVGLLLVACVLAGPAAAEKPARPGVLGSELTLGDYVGRDVMIPMRDGVQLHAEVWRPKGAAGPLPVIMQRSPYGFKAERVANLFQTEFKSLAHDRYIFVLEDVRGRFGSEGQFVMLRPRASNGGVDESTDTFDSIAWILGNVAGTNGKVGIFGISYLGWTTALSTLNPHPALKAVSIQASPEDMFIGDDFHHNGAFRLDYAWEYAAALETDGHTMNAFRFDGADAYDWYLKQPKLDDLDLRLLGRRLPTWRDFVAHPNYDAYHQARVTTALMPKSVSVPNLMVAGWWDQEDFYGPMTIYRRQAAGPGETKNYLVVGPWNHGGWGRLGGTSYGPINFGSDTSEYFREYVEAPWFRYWLKGEGKLEEPGALVFETGSNTWRRYPVWPPQDGVERKSLYFRAGGLLSFDPPTAGETSSDSFISDPSNPVPYRLRPIEPVISARSTWGFWLADDQSPFASRADVLSWRTEALTTDVTLRGDAVAKIYAATTGTDADWIVKLLDVYPADAETPVELRGRQVLIADEVFRGRFRKSFSHPNPLTPNVPLDYAIDLHTVSHVFKKGHRIAVQVQSSWFPLIDRNPQVFIPNILEATASQFHKETHSVFHTPLEPSAIEVDVAVPEVAH